MKKEDFINGLWFWRTNDGYFKKINNPCLVIDNSNEVIKIKMFKASGDVEELVISTEKDIDILIKQSRICEKEEVVNFFRKNLSKVEKVKNDAQLKIDKLTNNLLLVS